MKPLHETIAERIRRVCVKPKEDAGKAAPSGSFPFSVVFLVLGMATIGLIVAATCTNLYRHYTDLLMNLSRGQ
jgi:hypothetical protein